MGVRSIWFYGAEAGGVLGLGKHSWVAWVGLGSLMIRISTRSGGRHSMQ